jgi:hypothetical protein
VKEGESIDVSDNAIEAADVSNDTTARVEANGIYGYLYLYLYVYIRIHI